VGDLGADLSNALSTADKEALSAASGIPVGKLPAPESESSSPTSTNDSGLESSCQSTAAVGKAKDGVSASCTAEKTNLVRMCMQYL
jgi:hypothetical protein